MSEHVRVEAAKSIRIELGGKTIAESTQGYIVHEVGLPDRYYVSRADVRAQISDGKGEGVCPWKGKWRHLNVDVDGTHVANGAWTYYEPTENCEPLRDKIAFYENKVDRISVA